MVKSELSRKLVAISSVSPIVLPRYSSQDTVSQFHPMQSNRLVIQ
jgi:hypothetical protein